MPPPACVKCLGPATIQSGGASYCAPCFKAMVLADAHCPRCGAHLREATPKRFPCHICVDVNLPTVDEFQAHVDRAHGGTAAYLRECMGVKA